MFKKVMKKIACGVLTVASVAACAATFTACETNNPEVTMTLEFNGETYTLEYKLYRKIAPATTKHFIWLAENGYYNDMVIHDYDPDNKKMYTGAYKLVDGELNEEDYNGFVTAEERVKSFPSSVWMDEEASTSTYTLYGEFKDNDVSVKNGDFLKESFGSLTMYYHAKETSARVYAKLQKDSSKIARREYKYNSVTSMFYISTVTSATPTNSYCTFATLKDGKDELEALQEAIADYIETNYEGEEADFVTDKKMTVDKNDYFVGTKSTSKTFSVPNEPIKIKSVKVKSY